MPETNQPSDLPVWATAPIAGGVQTPTVAKQELGWAGTTDKPPYQFFNWFQNLCYLWIVYFLENAKRAFGANVVAAEITISTGEITPQNYDVRLRTEGAAANDTLQVINSDELGEGRIILLTRANPAESVSVFSSPTIKLREGLNFTLDSDESSLTLRNMGGVWTEIARQAPSFLETTSDEINRDFSVPAGRSLSHPNLCLDGNSTANISGTILSGNIAIKPGSVISIETGGKVISQY